MMACPLCLSMSIEFRSIKTEAKVVEPGALLCC
uniref:Uncharacterized protein n=1 Tax=Anguilla anguilla TaxID=7936 RepID=A0A0E9PZP5_ANGAN